ncbi:hypothetical protein ACFL1A_02955 [Patescibacteria group bacterium]
MRKIAFRILSLLTPFVIFTGIFLSIENHAYANEGKIELNTGSVSCQGISVWQDDRYRVVGRCQGLIYPYEERLDEYVIWVKLQEDDSYRHVDEIEYGFFEFQIDKRYTEVLVTAEENKSVKKPGDVIIIKGNMQPIGFGESVIAKFEQSQSDQPQDEQVLVEPTITPTPTVDQKESTDKPFNIKDLSPTVIIIIVSVLVIIFLGVISFLRR